MRLGGKMHNASFSPVAGIQWVETIRSSRAYAGYVCFSPVAGIQWVETNLSVTALVLILVFQSRCRDSVG